MERSLVGETKGPSVSQGIPRTVRNLGSSEHGSSQINPFYTLPSCYV